MAKQNNSSAAKSRTQKKTTNIAEATNEQSETIEKAQDTTIEKQEQTVSAETTDVKEQEKHAQTSNKGLIEKGQAILAKYPFQSFLWINKSGEILFTKEGKKGFVKVEKNKQ